MGPITTVFTVWATFVLLTLVGSAVFGPGSETEVLHEELTPVRAAHARADLVNISDRWGDVRLSGVPGLRPAARRAIDLRRARVRQVAPHRFRFMVKVRRLARPRVRHDQMFYFVFSKGPHATQVGFTHRAADRAFAYRSKGNRSCDLGRVRRRPARNVVWVDVPRRCMPQPGSSVLVSSYTGVFRSDAPWFSSDVARTRARFRWR